MRFLWNRCYLYSYCALIVNSLFHCVQDGGPLPSSLMTQMQSTSPAVTGSCSAGGGKEVKGPQDLNFTTCRYILGTESALGDTMNSIVQGLRYTSSRISHAVLKPYLLCCVFMQFYLQSSNRLPHHLDSVRYFFLICSLLLFQANSLFYAYCYISLLPIVNACTCSSERDAGCLST